MAVHSNIILFSTRVDIREKNNLIFFSRVIRQKTKSKIGFREIKRIDTIIVFHFLTTKIVVKLPAFLMQHFFFVKNN